MRSSYQKALLVILLTLAMTSQARAGSILRLFFDQLLPRSVNIAPLRADPRYPKNTTTDASGASDSERKTDFLEGTTSAGDDFGSLIRGWITLPKSSPALVV